jgi:hypothetical protein
MPKGKTNFGTLKGYKRPSKLDEYGNPYKLIIMTHPLDHALNRDSNYEGTPYYKPFKGIRRRIGNEYYLLYPNGAAKDPYFHEVAQEENPTGEELLPLISEINNKEYQEYLSTQQQEGNKRKATGGKRHRTRRPKRRRSRTQRRSRSNRRRRTRSHSRK